MHTDGAHKSALLHSQEMMLLLAARALRLSVPKKGLLVTFNCADKLESQGKSKFVRDGLDCQWMWEGPAPEGSTISSRQEH